MKGRTISIIVWVMYFPLVFFLIGCSDSDDQKSEDAVSTPADGCMGKLLSCFEPSASCEQDQNGIYYSNSANQIPDQPAYLGETPDEYISNQADTSAFCFRVHITGIGKAMITDGEGRTYYYLAQQREGQNYPNSTTDQTDLMLNGNITVLCADNTEEYYTRGNSQLLYGAGIPCDYVGVGPCSQNDYCNPNCAEGEDPDCEFINNPDNTDCEIEELACDYRYISGYYMCVDSNMTFADPDCDDIRCEADGVCDPNCPAQEICDQSCIGSVIGGDIICKDELPNSVECKLPQLHPGTCNNTECGCDIECLADPDCTQ